MEFNMNKYCVINHVKVEMCNAKSGDILYGFPSVSAFLGSIHNIERKIRSSLEIDFFKFDGIAIVSHSCSCLADSDRNFGDLSFHQPRFPLDSGGNSQPFANEVYANMDCSVIVDVHFDNDKFNDYIGSSLSEEKFFDSLSLKIFDLLKINKFCSGNVVDVKNVCFCKHDEDSFSNIIRSLTPGYVLKNRSEILNDCPDGEDLLQFIFSLTRKSYQWNENDDKWNFIQHYDGEFLVPIEIGYVQIQSNENVECTKLRNQFSEHFIVESLYSIGEWLKPYKIDDFESVCWKYVDKNPVFLFAENLNYDDVD